MTAKFTPSLPLNIEVQTDTVEKLVYGGSALIRQANQGPVVFIEGALPTEQVRYRLAAKKQGVLRGEVLERLNDAESRQAPPCDIAEACGGCHWQHMNLPTQRHWKLAIVKEMAERQLKPWLLPSTLIEALPLGDEGQQPGLQYRNHVQWKVKRLRPSESSPTRYGLGYFAQHSHEVVVPQTCHLLPAPLETIRLALQEHLPVGLMLSEVRARINKDNDLLLGFTLPQPQWAILEAWCEDFRKVHPKLLGVLVQEPTELKKPEVKAGKPFETSNYLNPKNPLHFSTLWGQGYIEETLAGVTFELELDAFFQVNPYTSDTLISHLKKEISLVRERGVNPLHLADLYAGMGTFSLTLQGLWEKVCLAEQNQNVLEAASKLAKKRGILPKNWQAVVGDVSTQLAILPEAVDVTLIDPPRAGCAKEVLDWSAKATRHSAFYLSCDPATLMRDLKHWLEQHPDWRLVSLHMLDMFPQTYHIEVLAQLQRKVAEVF